ncbi:MAG TPA: lysophospholipid acyltransferase family protein [Cerasibacillus sp.]|uniref:lysophospholipid acyltransferase family protein n=1 Tax=Cerasibacillus sp. TaxID=2498711 RepID=UPI002F425272
MSLYQLAKFIVSIIFYPLFRIKVRGKENIPKEGAVIICSNHISNLDPPVVGITSPRVIHFMAKEELFKKTFLNKLLTGINAFPVRRGMGDRNALRNGLKILKEGKVLGLFPEGTRSRTGELGKPLAGVGFFALRSDAVVIPCAIEGSYKPFRRTIVTYGKPVNMAELRGQKASAQETADTIMKEIDKLLKDS